MNTEFFICLTLDYSICKYCFCIDDLYLDDINIHFKTCPLRNNQYGLWHQGYELGKSGGDFPPEQFNDDPLNSFCLGWMKGVDALYHINPNHPRFEAHNKFKQRKAIDIDF